MTLFAILAIWLGIDLDGFAHRIARAPDAACDVAAPDSLA